MPLNEECAVRCVWAALSAWTASFIYLSIYFPMAAWGSFECSRVRLPYRSSSVLLWISATSDKVKLLSSHSSSSVFSNKEKCWSPPGLACRATLELLVNCAELQQWISADSEARDATGYRSGISAIIKRYWPWTSQCVPLICGQWPGDAENSVWLVRWSLTQQLSAWVRCLQEQIHYQSVVDSCKYVCA